MSKEKTGTSSCLSRTGRETDLLYALNVAAASLQRPAHSEAEVFRVSSEQIAKLGLRGGLSLLDETGSRLIIRAVAFPEKTMKLLTTLEKLSGFKARDFEFNVAEVDTYRQVVETGEAEFVANSGAIIAQLLPESARPFARRILKAFGSLPAIFAPLIIEGRVQGILNVVGARLTAGDIPALVAFANHISVALDNARLFAAMQQTEAQYRCLYESANDGILIIEPVTTLILSANPKAVEMTGYAETELRAMPITALHPAAVAAEAHRLFETVRQQGQAIFELALNRRDGQQLVVQVSATMFEANGRLLMQSMMRDITERKRTEKEIRRRNRELALLNRVIAASAASLEPEDVLEMACRELALAFDVPQAVAALLNEEKTAAVAVAEYLAGGRPVALNTAIPVESNPSFEYLLTHKAPLVVSDAQNDQRLASIHDLLRQRGTVSLLILPLIIEGEVAGSLALDAIKPRTFSTRDVDLAWSVADQVAGALARAQLDRAHRRLSTAIEQAAEGVVITDTEGTILYVNPAFERVSGYSRSEAIGQNPRILKSAKQDAAFYREMWETISAGKIWRGRLVNKKKDGVLYTEETTISPVRDENGAVVNYVAVKRDVTRELQLEEQYRQAQKMEAIGRLTGGIAHDFNNLLTAINGFAELIQSQQPPDSPFQDMVSKILRSGQRATDLVGQLMAFSRKQIIESKILDLNTVVANIDKMLRRIIGEDIELRSILTPDLWPAKVDPAQMEQVIVNLAVNARDAMPDGGQLTIETANVVLDDDYTAGHMESQPGKHVLLAISDTGTGMSAEVKAHIFEPFFTTKEQGKGTGLGLATVFGIVKQSGGHIWVYSEPGRGTTFKIYLPCVAEAITSLTQCDRASDLLSGTGTVLLVEDESVVRELAARVLRHQGYTVLEAGNGEEALRLAQAYSHEIHLLLTDVIMPQMGGKELADRLAATHPDAKVLFTSGYTDDAIAHHGVLDPEVMFMQKPFSPAVLARKVYAVLDT